jgi:hypothetical protein
MAVKAAAFAALAMALTAMGSQTQSRRDQTTSCAELLRETSSKSRHSILMSPTPHPNRRAARLVLRMTRGLAENEGLGPVKPVAENLSRIFSSFSDAPGCIRPHCKSGCFSLGLNRCQAAWAIKSLRQWYKRQTMRDCFARLYVKARSWSKRSPRRLAIVGQE